MSSFGVLLPDRWWKLEHLSKGGPCWRFLFDGIAAVKACPSEYSDGVVAPSGDARDLGQGVRVKRRALSVLAGADVDDRSENRVG
jgi:hypothetical protein